MVSSCSSVATLKVVIEVAGIFQQDAIMDVIFHHSCFLAN